MQVILVPWEQISIPLNYCFRLTHFAHLQWKKICKLLLSIAYCYLTNSKNYLFSTKAVLSTEREHTVFDKFSIAFRVMEFKGESLHDNPSDNEKSCVGLSAHHQNVTLLMLPQLLERETTSVLKFCSVTHLEAFFHLWSLFSVYDYYIH